MRSPQLLSLQFLLLVLVYDCWQPTSADAEQRAYLATGVKIGEVTPNSAVVWARLTKHEQAVEGKFPGVAGQVRLRIRELGGPLIDFSELAWIDVQPENDFAMQHRLENLKPSTTYELRIDTRLNAADQPYQAAATGFTTAPHEGDIADISFTVVTGQEYHRRDSEQGHLIYDEMLKLKPSFFVHTGDVVYYDKADPYAKDADTARFKWHRMYSLPLQREFHLSVPAYFLKDDHDIVKNDCWPGQSYGELTWEQGLAIFREQTPAPEVPYRTRRWGRDLQVWLLEGREFRSPNNIPDGAEKTILGRKQLAWLEQTTAESDATFKIIISPTPIVGPDRSNKNDNHANRGFAHEGRCLRDMLASREDLYVVCGDRHWQYVSVDPANNLREYSCGPTSDKHAGGWSDDQFDEQMHQFLRVKGGFLSVGVDHPAGDPRLTFRHHAVDGKVVHEESWNKTPE